jgi:putative DNA primase/helicase
MANAALSAPLSAVLARLKKVRAIGDDFSACCPAHDDKNPSLSVSEGADGRVLVTCHVGCSFDAIVGALGMTKSDFYPERSDALPSRMKPPISLHRANGNGATNGTPPASKVESAPDEDATDDSKWPVVATYDYVDAAGKAVFQVRRKEPEHQPRRGKREKTFRQYRSTTTGWVAGIKEIAERPLYRLPELIEDLAAERTIVLVEGEKDCITGRELGFPVTAHAGGSKGWRPEYGKQLANANVVIIIDNDEPGRAWAAQAGTALIENGSYVSMLALPLAIASSPGGSTTTSHRRRWISISSSSRSTCSVATTSHISCARPTS